MRVFLGRFSALVAPAVVAAFAAAGPAAAVAPARCASVMPLEDVTDGMTGTGYTVAHGTEPEAFAAEVLGVMSGLVAPGRDVIIVKISGPLVDEAGGGWAGMSGSPVYVDGELIGALAYGFSLGPSVIAGLTPAEDMLAITGYPATAPRKALARVPLSRSMRTVIARSTGTPLAAVDDSLVRLKLPVSVSGVSAQRMSRVNKLLNRRHVLAIPYAGSAVGAGVVSTVDSLVPGGNFAAALSYGDITLAGVGTTTYVCEGQALAFGHPLLLTGRSSLGAGGADAVTVVTDPTLGPYKLANVGGPVGRLDQDRFAGVRAVDGEVATIPVKTAVTSLDTGLARIGETDVVFKSEFPSLAFFHLFANIDSVFDQIGAGSSSLEWTITGTRADGTPWTFHRTNMYVSDFDLSIESSVELLDELETIAFYPFEKVKFTGVEATASVEDTVRKYELTSVLVCRRGVCVRQKSIVARPGKTIRLRAVLTPSDGSADRTAKLRLTIPPRARHGGLIEVGGPASCFGEFGGEGCGLAVPGTFPKLLDSFGRQGTNNSLVATLRTGARARIRDRDSRLFDRVVVGSKQIPVFFPGQCCPPDFGGDFGEIVFGDDF